MKLHTEQLAATAWDAYAKAVGGVAFNGDPLPTWEEMAADPAKVKQTEAWRRCSTSVANQVLALVSWELGQASILPTPETSAPEQPSAEELPIVRALKYAESVLRKASERDGIAFNIYPAKSRSSETAAKTYTPPDHLPLNMWVHVELEPETDAQRAAIIEVLTHLTTCGIRFDTGEGLGSWDWEWDWSFRVDWSFQANWSSSESGDSQPGLPPDTTAQP